MKSSTSELALILLIFFIHLIRSLKNTYENPRHRSFAAIAFKSTSARRFGLVPPYQRWTFLAVLSKENSKLFETLLLSITQPLRSTS